MFKQSDISCWSQNCIKEGFTNCYVKTFCQSCMFWYVLLLGCRGMLFYAIVQKFYAAILTSWKLQLIFKSKPTLSMSMCNCRFIFFSPVSIKTYWSCFQDAAWFWLYLIRSHPLQSRKEQRKEHNSSLPIYLYLLNYSQVASQVLIK